MAGKTTLADDLARWLARLSATVIRASVDDFHHPREVRYRRGRTSPEGYYRDAFDLERIRRLLLDPLGPQGDRRYATAVFDWQTDTPVVPTIHVAPDDAILVADGVFLLRPEFRDEWDFSIVVWASEHERLARSKLRDINKEQSADDVERLFRARYAPAHELYWQLVSPKQLADVFIDNERPLEPHIAYRDEARP